MNPQTESLLELAFWIGELFREKRDLERELEATRIEHAKTLERCAEAEGLVTYLQERDDSRRELDEKLIAWCLRQEVLCNLARSVRKDLGGVVEMFEGKRQSVEVELSFLRIVGALADGVIAANNPEEVNPSSKTAVA